MASLYRIDKGTELELFRVLNGAGLTAEEAKKLSQHPKTVDDMLETMRRHEAFRLVHGRFTPFADKIAMVKAWNGVDPKDVTAAVELADRNGTIAGFKAESPDNPLLDLVIVPCRENVPTTLLYGRKHMKEAFDGRFDEWEVAYAQGVDENRVKLIPGAREFRPNTIVVQAVDFGANWDLENGNVLHDVQEAQAGKLADFAGLFNASQSPKWVEQMDGTNVPYAILAALLLSVPDYDSWAYSPDVWHDAGGAKLHGDHVGSRFHGHSMAVVREYKS
ncbi:hypothetical protein HQ524_03030 [Candidatus Uhrbacteria bacterium]|nr:hypothetical protein [Candidatus Uhrbacteria bacterium]